MEDTEFFRDDISIKNNQSNWQNYYTPPNEELWSGRQDSDLPERFNQVIKLIDLSNESLPDDDTYSFVIIGFACDEGVKRNHGRVGASKGPDIIRQCLANLPYNHAYSINVVDVGNINCHNKNLEEAQLALAEIVEQVLLAGCHPIVLGGGHETAWGHYQGIANTNYADSLGIINFDAHFDLRPLLEHGQGSSGTPFTQIALARENEGLDFNYFCIGIQPMANTHSLYEEADILGAEYIEATDLVNSDNLEHIENFANFIESHDNLYVSIDLDVFANCFAPGVSAPQPLGIMPQTLLPYLKLLAASDKVISLDVVEYAPNYDQDNNTARLASQLIADYVDTACIDDE